MVTSWLECNVSHTFETAADRTALTLAVQMDFANGWFTDVFMESACAVRMALPQYLHLSSCTSFSGTPWHR